MNFFQFYVGNVGDSRCIVCIDGQAEALSIDHKPSDEGEKRRIKEAGGFVEVNRVNGNLVCSTFKASSRFYVTSRRVVAGTTCHDFPTLF